MTYELWYKTSEELTKTVIMGLSDTVYSASLLSDSQYERNIIADDGQGGVDSFRYSPDSDIAIFYTEATDPPVNLAPDNGETRAVQPVTLSWACSDPDGNPLTFDIFLGPPDGNLNQVGSVADENQFELPILDHETEYQWKIIAEDTEGRLFYGPSGPSRPTGILVPTPGSTRS